MQRRQLLVGLTGSCALAACGSRSAIPVGFLGPLSGRRADLGAGGRNGAIVAVEQANRQGGVHGRPLELLVEDDQLNPALAQAGFARLQARDVVAVVGAYTKPVCDAVVPLAAAADIPLVSPNLALDSAAAPADLLFRLNRTAEQNAQAYAKHLTLARQRRITLICELSSEEFVVSWLGHFHRSMAALGAPPGREIRYTSGPGTRFDALVSDALTGTCDGALLIAPTVDVARLCQQLRQQRPGLPVATIDRNGNDALLRLGGRAVEGLVLLQSFDPECPDQAFRTFVEQYQARFAERPGQSAVMAYDAVAVVSQALQRSPAGGASLRNRILSQGPYQGLQQPMTFDPDGVAARSAWFVRVRDGRFVTTGPA